jgi:CheY-like chemotaxis protein
MVYAGLDDYLPKPVVEAEVLKLAAKWIRNAQSHHQVNVHSEKLDSAAAPTDVKPKLRVLLAEDNRANTLAITRLIEKHGLEAVAVMNGEEALRAVRDQPRFALCLMDLHMPIMDGVQATHAIRELEAGLNESRRLPIIGLTATLGPAERQTCLNAGMDGAGEKPLNVNKFREWIHKYAGVHVEFNAPETKAANQVDQSARDKQVFDTDRDTVMERVHSVTSAEHTTADVSPVTSSDIPSPVAYTLSDLKLEELPHECTTKAHLNIDSACRGEVRPAEPPQPAEARSETGRNGSNSSCSEFGADTDYSQLAPSNSATSQTAENPYADSCESEFGATSQSSEDLTVNKHVLVVEDNVVSQKLMKLMLERDGWIVHTAENGQIGVDKTAETEFACVLMDCDMPVKDGWQATREIREREAKRETPWVPIIAVTANAMAGDRQKCIAAGMDDYISKPVQRKPVLIAVKTWAAKRLKRLKPRAAKMSSSSKKASDSHRALRSSRSAPKLELIVEEMTKVLLCDASSYARALAGGIADMGFDVTLVLNMRDALQLVQKAQFHTVIVTPSFSHDVASVQTLKNTICSRIPVESQRKLEMLIATIPGGLATDDAKTVPNAELLSGMQILYAEDNPVSQHQVKNLLQTLGVRCHTVENGRAAIQAIMTEPDRFGLILMDCNMPVMDGWTASTIIRELEETGTLVYKDRNRIPIVGFTVNQLKGDTHKCLKTGMDDYLAKPASSLEHLQMIMKWTSMVRPLRDVGSERSSRLSTASNDNLVESNALAQCLLRLKSSVDVPTAPEPLFSAALNAKREVTRACCTHTASVNIVSAIEEYFGLYSSFTEIFLHFVDDLKPHLERLVNAFDADEADMVRHEAHSLKGASGSCSAQLAYQMCQSLESTIKEHATQPWPPPKPVYDQLKFTIDALSREVDNLCRLGALIRETGHKCDIDAGTELYSSCADFMNALRLFCLSTTDHVDTIYTALHTNEEEKALPVLRTLIEFGGKLFLSDLVHACRELEASISREGQGVGLLVHEKAYVRLCNELTVVINLVLAMVNDPNNGHEESIKEMGDEEVPRSTSGSVAIFKRESDSAPSVPAQRDVPGSALKSSSSSRMLEIMVEAETGALMDPADSLGDDDEDFSGTYVPDSSFDMDLATNHATSCETAPPPPPPFQGELKAPDSLTMSIAGDLVHASVSSSLPAAATAATTPASTPAVRMVALLQRPSVEISNSTKFQLGMAWTVLECVHVLIDPLYRAVSERWQVC